MTDEDIDFEEQVKKIIKEYKAPENIEDELIEFLINSGNVYAIIDTYKETSIKLMRKQNETNYS